MNLTGKPRDLQDSVIAAAAKKLSNCFGMELKELPQEKSGAPQIYVVLNKIHDDPNVCLVTAAFFTLPLLEMCSASLFLMT